jgi:hypothetical protein
MLDLDPRPVRRRGICRLELLRLLDLVGVKKSGQY